MHVCHYKCLITPVAATPRQPDSTPCRTIQDMFAAFLKAFGQMFTPGFQWVLLKSLALTIGLFVLALWGLQTGLDTFNIFPWAWLNTTVDIIAGLGVVAGMVFLIGPITALFAGLFLDRIAEQVERRHYPNDAPGVDPPIASSMWIALKFTFIIILVNILVLLIALLPGVNILAYLVGNGYLLGREFFELVAARFMPRREVKALRKANAGKVFVAGVIIAFVAAIPFVNFLVPLFATAFMVHVYKGVMRKQGERPPKVSLRTR